MTTQLNQLTELTVTSDDDLILIREDSTGVDKRMRAQNIRAKATTKGDVGLGNVPDLDTTDAVNKAHDQNTDTALAQGTGDQVTASEARSHIDATNNPHGVTKAQVGLSDVPNLDTADAVAKAHDQNTDTKLAEGTPDEVTAADARAHIDATDNPHSVTKAQVGLSNVDNVSAADLRDRSTHTGTQTLATISDAGTIASQNADSVSITGGNIDATIAYDNTSSGLSSTNVQAAIDEVTGLTAATQASAITYDNTASGLVAQDVQAAIDELQSITAAEDAININYDNTASGLVAEDVQAAIDEVQGGLGTAAAANTVDLLDRANHTGTQTLATISDAGTIASQDADDVAITGGNIDATLAYDNTASGLTATNVQAAIDELEARPAVEDADQVNYDNTASGLTATDVQAAIDELEARPAVEDAGQITYDNTASGLVATDVQAAIDETADELGLALIKDGVDPAVARAVAYNDIGAPVAGGYFAGVIDTVKGTIQANDDYQTGERYALIVAPKELEGGLGSSPAPSLTTGNLEWDTTATTAGEAGTLTRWDGLSATDVIIAKNDAKYEVHNFIKECRDLYPAPATAGGSNWYLPALDELELLYRNFKPNYEDNDTQDLPRTFPGSQPSGTNPSSDPTSPVNANNPRRPEKTPVLGFRENEAAAVDLERYWSTTDADEDSRAWNQRFTFSGLEGFQAAANKDTDTISVRPVRRVAL